MIKQIKFVVFDYDGVFTDGSLYVIDNIGFKKYNCRDGSGISRLHKNNIKTGIISAHKLDTNVKDVVNHLGIHYYSQGNSNKMKILNRFIEDNGYSLDEVAYIGDDLSDIEVLSNVGFSACPNDAIDSCKDIVDYICEKKGGEGCVREFIELILKNNKSIEINKSIISKTIKQIKIEACYQLDNFHNIDFEFITNKILQCTGNIYITGVGKSEDISIHLVNLMKSISIKAYYINIMNSTHGDIGCIDNNDIIIFFSKSGNTKEIIEKIELFNCYKFGICCNENSLFSKHCDNTIIIPCNGEIKNSKNINCIPSNSYMSQLFFSNILINNLIEKSNITLDLYKSNHPAGNIGDNLKKIKDIMITEFPKIILDYNIKLNKVLLEMTKYNIGCCFFVNDNNNLLGVLSDGDIRRILLNNNINDITIENINNKFTFINNADIYMKNLVNDNIIKYKKAKFIPVIEKNIIVGIIDSRVL
jgi:3-deoxy-D-manno-octulosonate 8-phosphate phosphatase (KDO 8-P phosphatase)